MSDYLKKRMQHILADRPIPEKKIYKIKAVSDKRAAKIESEKKARGENDTDKEAWFKARRWEMKGRCQCGCGRSSEKDHQKRWRNSIAHIFPKKLFDSIRYHKLNWVERAWEGGCHNNMDDRSLDLWPTMADWKEIKERFHVLAPLLTEDERTTKFYKHLERLIYSSK